MVCSAFCKPINVEFYHVVSASLVHVQTQSRQVAEQRAVVDEFKKVGTSFASLVGGEEGRKINEMVQENLDKYLEITYTVNEQARNLETVLRQTAEVCFMLCVRLCVVGLHIGHLAYILCVLTGSSFYLTFCQL